MWTPAKTTDLLYYFRTETLEEIPKVVEMLRKARPQGTFRAAKVIDIMVSKDYMKGDRVAGIYKRVMLENVSMTIDEGDVMQEIRGRPWGACVVFVV